MDVLFEKNENPTTIHSNVQSPSFNKEEWLKNLFVECPSNIHEMASNLEQLNDEYGNIIGIVLPPEWCCKVIFPINSSSSYFPCITTIGGLSTSIESVNKGYVGYVNGIEKSVSRNSFVFDESSKKCLEAWANNKYRENYDKIIVSNELSTFYSRLIDSLCQMSGRIIWDNIRLLYSTYYEKIEIGTISGLIKINRYILSGAVPFLLYPAGLQISSIDFEKLFDHSVPKDWKEQKIQEINNISNKFDRDLINALMEIDEMPSSNYNEIIFKYWRISNLHLFSVDNLAPAIWLNLLLNKQMDQMIDWRKINPHILRGLSHKSSCNELGDYLGQFLSKTYLNEIITSRNVNF